MATNNSGPSFFDNAKEYAGNVASNAYNQTKDEFSRVSQNSRDRDWVVERESKLNNLTLSQKEQLKYISSADDATKFVEAATAGDKEGAEKLYSQALKSQGGAILSFAGDVATTALGGAAGKAAIKAAPKLFKGAAEVIGENIPSLKKYSNVFKSSADRADEALAAERTARAAAREQRAQESIQRAQAEQQQARTARNSTQSSETPFRSNTTRATETVQETITPPPEQSIFGKVADWTKDKIVQGANWAGGKVVEGAKSVGSGILSLGKTTLKGMGAGAVVGGAAGEYYDSLSDEEKQSWQEKAQKGVDWFDNAIDNPGEAWEDIKNGASSLLGDAGSAALGATVGKGSNPFKGIGAGMGSLFAGGGSVGASLNSMPSGGDSGITGEGHFGGDNVQGTSAIEVLNKIYNILARTYDTVNLISRNVSTLTRSQSQQNAANDINFANAQARQNEGTATPMYVGGGGSSIQSGGEEDSKSEGFWSKLASKVNPKAAAAAVASAVNPAKKARTLWNIGKKVAPTVAKVGATALGAELLKSGDSDGSDKALYAKKFFMDKGYTEEQAAGIVGNLQGESGNFNKDVISGERRGDGGKAVGIAQWHPDRQAKFKEIMHKDLIGSSYEDQLEFVNWELNNSHKKAGDDLRKQTTAAGAAKSVEGKFEITAASMHGGHSPERVRNAEKLMGKSLPDKKETSSAKPEINGTKLTGDTKRNPYFGQETTPFEENEEVTTKTVSGDEVTTKTVSGGGVTIKTAPEYVKTDLDKAVEAHEQDPLNNPDPLASVHSKIKPQGYLEAKDADLEKRRNAVEADMKANKITTDEANAKYDDINREQNNNEWDKMEKADAATASPITPYNYSSEITESKNSGLSDLEKEKKEKLEAIGARRGKGEDDAALDAEGEKVIDEYHAKKQAATATPVKNDDAEEQIAEIDRQKATLENERNEIGQSGVNVDKQTMDKQLDRLSDIHTEMSSLNEQRNNLSGGQPSKQSSPKPASQQQAQQTPPPAAPAGTGKSVPGVRNDDPTIKMMEEGSLWSTNGGLMA